MVAVSKGTAWEEEFGKRQLDLPGVCSLLCLKGAFYSDDRVLPYTDDFVYDLF